MKRRVPSVLLLVMLATVVIRGDGERLAIDPVQQETPSWCWLAVGQMIFEHFDIPPLNPNYQCGIVAFWGARLTPYGWVGPCMNNCGNCPLPAGGLSTIEAMLRQYPVFAEERPLTFSSSGAPIGKAAIRTEIDSDRPILVGITPSGARLPVSQHVALIVGYEEDDDDFDVIVNDPFPYRAFGIDPFEQAGAEMQEPGQYRIRYETLRDRLRWKETIYRLRH